MELSCVWQLARTRPNATCSLSHVSLQEVDRVQRSEELLGSKLASKIKSTMFFLYTFLFPEKNVCELKLTPFLQQSH